VKKRIVVVLVFLISSVLFQVLPAEARSNSTISLEEGNIVLPDSDVELISAGEGIIYAVVNYQDEHCLFLSENRGRTWQNISDLGLPEEERVVSLKTLVGQSEVVALATTTSVYLSQDGGKHFDYLGSPDLAGRGEEITSLAITKGNPPRILVGVWHPDQGKFPREGVYLWGSEGKHSWKGQGMPSWQEGGYFADVTSVAFFEEAILAVATGDPDGSGPLPEGTYLNIGYLNDEGALRADWNWLQNWPVEITDTSGSPTEKEILNSQLVFPEDLNLIDSEDWSFYVLYNSSDQDKDGIYKVLEGFTESPEVYRLELPGALETVSLDSIDYHQESLVVGMTVKKSAIETGESKQVRVYYLPVEGQFSLPGDWLMKKTSVPDTQNCQVVFSPDGLILVATSGQNSSFSLSKGDFLVPVSLMDISGEIGQLSPSPRFSRDRTLFLNYGGQSILKVKMGSDYQLRWAERILFVPEEFEEDMIEIQLLSDSLIFVFEAGTDQFWTTKNGGLSWIKRKTQVEMIDAQAVEDETVYIAGEDGMLYRSENGGKSWSLGISSGIRWLQRIELGPRGKILALGSVAEEDTLDTISLVDERSFKVLPVLPVSSGYADVVLVSQRKTIYAGIDDRLYQLADSHWEEIAEFEREIDELLISPQGLYVFFESYLCFSSFPLNVDSQWETIELEEDWADCRLAELEEERNVLLFWDYSEIVAYSHQILEEEIEEEIEEEPKDEILPDPDKEEPAQSQSTEPESKEPKPTKPEPTEPRLELIIPEAVEEPPAEKIFPPRPTPEKPEGGWVVPTLITFTIIEFLIIVGLIIYIRRIPYY